MTPRRRRGVERGIVAAPEPIAIAGADNLERRVTAPMAAKVQRVCSRKPVNPMRV